MTDHRVIEKMRELFEIPLAIVYLVAAPAVIAVALWAIVSVIRYFWTHPLF